MKTMRFIAIALALIVATPFVIIGLVVGPMKLGFEVGLDLWQRFEDSAHTTIHKRART